MGLTLGRGACRTERKATVIPAACSFPGVAYQARTGCGAGTSPAVRKGVGGVTTLPSTTTR